MKTEERKVLIIFKFNDKREYETEILSKLKIKNLKRILISMANLANRKFQLMQNSAEITDSQNDLKVEELFPNQNEVLFQVIEKDYKKPEDSDKVLVKQGAHCSEHNYKYVYFFCYTCNKSICSQCVKNNHYDHSIIDKHDYLQNSQFLIDSLFKDLDFKFQSASEIKNQNIVNLRSDIKNTLIPNLHKEVDKLEIKLLDLVDYYLHSFEQSLINLKENLKYMKKSYTNGLEELKYQIKIKDIMIDHEVFRLFDEKMKEINDNKLKFIQFFKLDVLTNLSSEIETNVGNVYSNLNILFQTEVLTTEREDLKKRIDENTLDKVNENEVYELVFSIKKSISDIKEEMRKVNFIVETPSKQSSHKNSEASVRKDIEIRENQIENQSKLEDEKVFPKKLFEDDAIVIDESISKQIKQEDSPIQPKKKVKDDIKIQQKTEQNPNRTRIVDENNHTSVVIRVIPGTNQMFIYKDELETKIIHKEIDANSELNLKQFKVGSSWINYDNKLFVTGGLEQDEATNSFFSYDNKNDKFLRLANMLNCRSGHSSIIQDNFLYVVGGKNCNTCEKYDFKLQKWIPMPPQLEKERINPILYFHQRSNILYSFFGLNSKNDLIPSVERIRTDTPKGKWELVTYKNTTNADFLRTNCGVVDKEDKIIMVGGIGKEGLKKSIIYFDFNNFSFSEMENNNEEENCVFIDNRLFRLSDNYYGNFNKDMDFLKFRFDD
jgi:hypothetical protein